MYKNSDGTYDIFHGEFYITIVFSDKWIGLRAIGTANIEEQRWRERIGQKQKYQLNLIPCVSIIFYHTRWSKIPKEKKK